MRIAEPTLNMFLSETKRIESLRQELQEAAQRWMEFKHAIEGNGPAYITRNQVAYSRSELESALTRYRAQLSKLYDLMGDRGLIDYESLQYEVREAL